MLTSECAKCPFWRDTKTENGCAYPRPIDECKAFNEAYNTAKKFYGLSVQSRAFLDMIKEHLSNTDTYFEVSEGSFEMGASSYHIEVLLTPSEKDEFNDWLMVNSI